MEFGLAEVFDAVASAIPDREALVFRDRHLSYRELRERTNRFANFLLSESEKRGVDLTVAAERPTLAGHESGQAHLAIYAYNGNEYIEGFIGAFAARVAPLNVNYRYVEEELLYLFQNAGARVVLYHAEFAPQIAAIRDRLPDLGLLVQIADDSGEALLPGAVDYETALASASPERPDIAWSPDDLYMLYTGGTTGMPKGVLWRSADIFVAAMGGRRADQSEFESLDEIVTRAVEGGGVQRSLVTPPLMHGAAQWGSMNALCGGQTVAYLANAKRFDADDMLDTIVREQINTTMIVGDAFARPLLDRLAARDDDLSCLKLLANGGAPLTTGAKEEFLDRIPGIIVLDGIGSSETGAQAVNTATKDTGVSTGDFRPMTGAAVVSADLDRVLSAGEDEMGWFAQQGRVPLGYLGDAEKTARTFPEIDGIRYAVPGDRARLRADGIIDVLGRDSVTINSGGEKIFAEEVEHALKLHEDVFDAVVCGRPSERWGQEVVAIVRPKDGRQLDEATLRAQCEQHLARYKWPKAFVFKDEIVRSPSGKADYRWARAQAEEAQ